MKAHVWLMTGVFVSFSVLGTVTWQACTYNFEIKVTPLNLPDVPPEESLMDAGVHDSFLPSTMEDVVNMFVDGTVSTRDAGINLSTPDVATLDVDAMDNQDVVTMPVIDSGEAIVVYSSTCQDRGLHLPTEFIHPGWTYYHTCVTTPTVMTSTNALASQRPTAIVFEKRDDGSADFRDVLRVLPPRTANPWVGSVVIGLPSPTLLNARNEYEDGSILRVIERNEDGSAFLQHGLLRIWQVTPEGQQVRVDYSMVATQCVDLVVPYSQLRGGFLPLTATCPADLAECPSGIYMCSR